MDTFERGNIMDVGLHGIAMGHFLALARMIQGA